MKKSTFVMGFVLFIVISVFCVIAFTWLGKEQGDSNPGKWEKWIGKKVNVRYACCGLETCRLIQSAKLKDVTDKGIFIIINGSQHFIPKHMIKSMEIAR